MVSCAAATAISTGLLLASYLPRKPEGFRKSLCGGNMVGTQSRSSMTEELQGTTLEQGRVGHNIPARPKQSWVQEVRPVCSSNDKYLPGGMKAIKLRQKL